jgi:peptide YY
MDSLMIRITVCISAILVLLCHVTVAQDAIGPPERPEVFRNPEELREYLKQLNEYFAIVGRPRLGLNPFIHSVSGLCYLIA